MTVSEFIGVCSSSKLDIWCDGKQSTFDIFDNSQLAMLLFGYADKKIAMVSAVAVDRIEILVEK